jgi:hypothetical protein
MSNPLHVTPPKAGIDRESTVLVQYQCISSVTRYTFPRQVIAKSNGSV